MENYEPAEKIISEAKIRADSIIRKANYEAGQIRGKNLKEAEALRSKIKEEIAREVDREYSLQYSKTKIEKEKLLQNAAASKLDMVRQGVIDYISSSPVYRDIINKMIAVKTSGKGDFKVFAGQDMGLVQKSSPQEDPTIKHGFKLEFSNKSFDFDLEHEIDEILKGSNALKI